MRLRAQTTDRSRLCLAAILTPPGRFNSQFSFAYPRPPAYLGLIRRCVAEAIANSAMAGTFGVPSTLGCRKHSCCMDSKCPMLAWTLLAGSTHVASNFPSCESEGAIAAASIVRGSPYPPPVPSSWPRDPCEHAHAGAQTVVDHQTSPAA